MRTKTVLALLALALVIAACTAEQETTLVTAPGVAPYYTNLEDALAAAAADQYVVADFYTDW